MKLESLLPASRRLLRVTDDVFIDRGAIALLAPRLKKRFILPAHKDFSKQPLLFYLLVDGLNFCFWHPEPKQRFTFRGFTGSVGFGYALLYAMERRPRLFAPRALREKPTRAFSALLEGTRGILLLREERIRIMKEIGSFAERIDIESALHAFEARDVNSIARFLLQSLPYTFADITKTRGVELLFFKKLRLLISDLAELAGFRFKRLDTLLIYADYKIPQLFLNAGVMQVSAALTRRIRDQRLIAHNALPEIILRAGSVVAAAHLKTKLAISYPELDFRLWRASKLPEYMQPFPHHRTMSRFY